MTRRRFIQGVLAAAAAASVAMATRTALSPPTYLAFEFHHDAATAILISRSADPERLDIEVRRHGATVERFENAHPYRMFRLRSDYFSVSYHDPPTA